MTTSPRNTDTLHPTGFDRTKVTHWIAFGFGSGLAPKAPGTFGTLAAIPLYVLMSQLNLALYAGLLLAFTLFGIWVCGRVADDIGTKDPSAIVWDEFVGFLLTMIVAPPGWVWILVGFLAFRLFDIWKPWPIRVVDQQVGGGLGIMLDDIIAGVMAAALLMLLALFF